MNGYTYQLNAIGNRTNATEPSGRALSWTYDNINRLTNETINLDPHSNNGTVSYGLDPVGNRLSQDSTLPGISSGNFTYDANDRLSTETYDASGNTLTSGARTFIYDFENRLKSMTMSGTTVTIIYDGDGNRVAKTANGITTRYLVDNLNPTGYAQVVEELLGAAVTRTYTYGRQRVNQNQLINSTWTSGFYGYDGMGSVRQLTDSTGTVTDTYSYDAWGNSFGSTGSTPNVYLYRGEQYDSDLRLYYLRARHFNPLTGRFLSRDPAAGQPAFPRTQHKYLYVGGNPVNKKDPSGRFESGEYGLLSLNVLKSAAGAEAIGCAAGIAGVVTTWVMGLAESGIDAVGVGGGLSLTACGVTFTEEVLKNPFGVYRALPASVMKWSGRLSPVLGASHCALMLYELFDAMTQEPEGTLSEQEITQNVLEEFVQGFECGMFIGAAILL